MPLLRLGKDWHCDMMAAQRFCRRMTRSSEPTQSKDSCVECRAFLNFQFKKHGSIVPKDFLCASDGFIKRAACGIDSLPQQIHEGNHKSLK